MGAAGIQSNSSDNNEADNTDATVELTEDEKFSSMVEIPSTRAPHLLVMPGSDQRAPPLAAAEAATDFGAATCHIFCKVEGGRVREIV